VWLPLLILVVDISQKGRSTRVIAGGSRLTIDDPVGNGRNVWCCGRLKGHPDCAIY
jgi:hypothetical protein